VNVLVTGASGFLGGHVVRHLLDAGHSVRALVRPTSDRSDLQQVPCVVGDLDVPATLLHAVDGVDAVVHAAAKVDDAGSRQDFMRTNVSGTQALLRAARPAGVRRFVFISSPSVVMHGRDQRDIDESTPYPHRFLHPYAETKALAEQAVLAARGAGFETVCLRPRGIWGPGDWSGPLPRLLGRMARGRLPDVSGGRQVLADLCYVGSVAHGVERALLSDAADGGTYFLTDDDPVDVWAFAHHLAERLDLSPPRRRLNPRLARALARGVETAWRAPGLRDRSPPLSRYGLALISRTHTYDISAARRDLDYAPVVSREQGLEHYLAWVEAQGGVRAYLAGVAG